MGPAEKVAKLEALLERVQQRASQPRAHESGAISVTAIAVAAVDEAPATRRRPAVDLPRGSMSSLPTRPAPPIAPTPPSRRTPLAGPPSSRSQPGAPPLPPRSQPALVARPVVRESAEDLSLGAGAGTTPTAPEPSPVTTASGALLGAPREPLLTPTATIITPNASEKPRVRVNPEMTAPVAAEEVAAAAAAMNRVPTFPDSWPVDASAASVAASATSAAVAASRGAPGSLESVEVEPVFPLSGPKFEGGEGKDIYLEDGEEPTKPLLHPPRTWPPKAAQQLAAETDLSRARPATIPFDAYPPPRASSDVSPGSEQASPRAMVVPREVEASPAFLSNLRPQKEGGGGFVRWLLILLVIAGAAYAAYSFGILKPSKK